MSDSEEVVSQGDFVLPVPELDDHRRSSLSVPGPARSRRGTFDSLYRQQHAQDSQRGGANDEAVIDEEGQDASPSSRRSRRPTAGTLDPRSVSPPNSVKAFAEARRRDRAPSACEDVMDKVDRLDVDGDPYRARSIASRQSQRSRPYGTDDNGDSLATNGSAEEDVCFPFQEENNVTDGHRIDFDLLESAMMEQKNIRERDMSRMPSANRVFTDLRPEMAAPQVAADMFTPEGDFMKVPSHLEAGTPDEKNDSSRQNLPEPSHQQDNNRYSFFSTEWDATIHAADFVDLVLPGEDLSALFALPKGDEEGVWWLNVNNPSDEETRILCRGFGVHPLTMEDILTQESREKIELFPSYYFSCFRSFNTERVDDMVEYEPFHLYVVVFRDGILSLSFTNNAHATDVRSRILKLKKYLSISSDWICYALIDAIVDSFQPVIHQVEMDAEMIEDEVFLARPGDHSQFLRKIGGSRKSVMSLMRLLGGKADVLKGFTKRCNENYKVAPKMEIGLYLGDIQDHVVTMMNNLNHCEKILGRAHSNYLAQLSVDNIIQTTEANSKLSKMTLLASIIVPMNVVTGLFGMNVPIPWSQSGTLVPFLSIMSILFAFGAIVIAIAKRMRWI